MIVKQIPEDFIVEEVLNKDLTENKTDYLIIKLTKRLWESYKIIEAISKSLRIKTKFIGIAGNKDKQAITTQYLSLYRVSKERIPQIKINNTQIEFAGYCYNRINLGDLKGNNFKITIRDLDKKVKLPEELQLENYFDDQRFGNKQNTHLVGKAMLQKDFAKVCSLLSLDVVGTDYVGAIRKQQRRLLRFYISSYQSYLWNKTLSEILKKQKEISEIDYAVGKLILTKNKMKDFQIPILNFDTPEDKIIDKILKEENVSRNDFIIKEIPELINGGVQREAFLNIEKIKYKWDKDELNKGKLKLLVEFFLPKGSYATMLIKKLGLYLN